MKINLSKGESFLAVFGIVFSLRAINSNLTNFSVLGKISIAFWGVVFITSIYLFWKLGKSLLNKRSKIKKEKYFREIVSLFWVIVIAIFLATIVSMFIWY